MFHSNKQVLTKLDSDGSGLYLGTEFIPAVFIRTSFKIYVLFVGFFTTIVCWQTASAQTFDQASTVALQRICRSGLSTDIPGGAAPLASVGADLVKICQGIADGNAGQPAASGVGTQSQPSSILISQQQLKDEQINKEKQEMRPGSADTIATRWGDRFSTFLTAGATTLRHRNNAYEQGYNAEIPSVTAGGGYLVANNLETGLAFNYSNSDGDYNTGGGFNIDSYTPLLYVTYLPFDYAFTNLALSYTRQNQSNDRIAVADSVQQDGSVKPTFRLNTDGNVNTNLYSLNFLSGEHPECPILDTLSGECAIGNFGGHATPGHHHENFGGSS